MVDRENARGNEDTLCKCARAILHVIYHAGKNVGLTSETKVHIKHVKSR